MRELIRKILNEEIPSQVRRRIPTFEETFKHYRDAFSKYTHRNFEIYWDIVMERVSESLYHAWFINTVPDDEWEESAEYVENYLIKKYKDETKKMWEKKHRKRLNELEDNKEKKIQKNLIVLNKLISMFDYSEVCDMWVRYNSEDGDFEIRSKMSTKNHNTSALEKEFEFLENSIKYLGFTNCYVFRPYYVERCKDEIKYMNESEEKNQSLLSLIDEHGLYEFMKMTGLSLPQIILKYDDLPREVFEKYIKDYLENEANIIPGSHGDRGLVLGLELSDNRELESFYLSRGKVTVEINEYDSGGAKISGSFERLENLSDDEIFRIVEDMSQLNDDYFDYM